MEIQATKVGLNDLCPGMVVTEAVKSPHGRLLMKEDTCLEAHHIRLFKIWGVTAVSVAKTARKRLDAHRAGRHKPQIVETAERLAETIFSDVAQDTEAAHELRELFVLRTAEAIERQGVDKFMGSLPGKALGEPPDPPPQPGSRTTSMEMILGEEVVLSSMPDIYHKILLALNDPRTSSRCIADIISKDAAICTRLLKLVNSSFFGLPHRIGSLSQAVSLIGSKQLSTITLGISVTHSFLGISSDMVDMRSFWKHSVACGLFSRLIAFHAHVRNSEQCFVAGLLHDIGRLVMLHASPELSALALYASNWKGLEGHAAEMRYWGFSHDQLAGRLFRKWKFPPILEQAVRRHHAPSIKVMESVCVHLAEVLTHTAGFGSSGNRHVPPIAAGAWRAVGLSRAAVELMTAQVEHQLDATVRLLGVSDG